MGEGAGLLGTAFDTVEQEAEQLVRSRAPLPVGMLCDEGIRGGFAVAGRMLPRAEPADTDDVLGGLCNWPL